MAEVDTRTSERSRARLRKMTISNLAALHQRLGADERALDLYAQLTDRRDDAAQRRSAAAGQSGRAPPASRRSDQGDARHTGRRKRSSPAAQHRDGEIGAWRNIGIAYAAGPERRPAGARRLRRGADAGARLVEPARRGAGAAVPRRDASPHGTACRSAPASSRPRSPAPHASGSSKSSGRRSTASAAWSKPRAADDDARRSYEQAIAAIESVRADLQAVALRSEFLADKRDVYDALIALRLSRAVGLGGATCSTLIEQSRARTWQDRLQPGAPAAVARRRAAEDRPRGVAARVLERARPPRRCSGSSSSAAGIVRQAASDGRRSRRFSGFADAVLARPTRVAHRRRVAAGRILLSGLPDLDGVTRLLVVPDGPLHFVPFEALTVPGSPTICSSSGSRSAICRRPRCSSAASPARQRRWKWPWQRSCSPSAIRRAGRRSASSRGAGRRVCRYADEEIRGIAGSLPGPLGAPPGRGRAEAVSRSRALPRRAAAALQHARDRRHARSRPVAHPARAGGARRPGRPSVPARDLRPRSRAASSW